MIQVRLVLLYDTNSVNSKQKKTFEAVFTDPVRSNIHYKDLEGLFVALGCEVYPYRAGSRVAVVLNGCKYSYHRPHPENEIGRKTISDVRDFLTAAGVEP
jgi:hypothetical protein